MKLLLLCCMIFAVPVSFADDGAPSKGAVEPLPVQVAAPAPAPTPPQETHLYHLSDLRPVSVSTYPTGVSSVLRDYLHFRNKDGNHYLVVEEDALGTPLKEVAGLQRSMGNQGASCDLDISCGRKAFCTGKCANMYYQISNAQSAKAQEERCRLISFTCEQGREKP